MQTHSSLQIVACAPNLPAAAQQQLARLDRRDPHIGRAQAVLASRPDLDGGAAAELAGHPDPLVRRRMLQTAAEVSLLRPRNSTELEAVAANRACAPELLTELLQHESPGIRLRAACNPSTPEVARRRALADPEENRQLVARSSPLGAQVVRAGALTANNRWLLEDADRQSSEILRGLAGLPECPVEVLQKNSRIRTARLHPALGGQDVGSMSGDDLAEHPSPAAHLALLDRPEMTAAQAFRVLQGARRNGGAGDIPAEPHIIAELVRRFGSLPLTCDGTLPVQAGSRITTSGWANAYSSELLQIFASWGCRTERQRTLEDADRTARILGDSHAAWHIFARLATGSHWAADLMVEAAEVASV